MARFKVLSWRGIPAQVKARDDAGKRFGMELPAWFTQEIDRVAMREGLINSEAYLAEWNWGAEEERPGSAEEVATAVVAELAAAWGHPVGADDAATADQA